VVGRTDVTYSDVDTAPAVVLVGLEPEEECPILFLRLRKAWRKSRLAVTALAPFTSRGLARIGATVVPTVPGAEAAALSTVEIRTALSQPGAILFVGERLATVPGGLSAAAALAARTGAKLAWVPRRAGDRGALEAGCLPTLLPGGRPVTDPGARAEMAHAWELAAGALSSEAGRDAEGILAAARHGVLGGLLVAGMDPGDFADPAAVDAAFDGVGFLVSLELRRSTVTERADVVFPVAPAIEKAGSYVDWEGRLRPFDAVLRTTAMSDARVLDALARELDVELGCSDAGAVHRELGTLAGTSSSRPAAPSAAAADAPMPGQGQAILATWHHLIDLGSLQDGDEHLAGTARPSLVRLGKALAADLGVADGDAVTVSTERGSITLPALVVDDMAGGVVWVPTNSPDSTVRRTLGVTAGSTVDIRAGGVR
jgi:NADH-quinone oxidoreductase subunit G